MSSTNSNPEQSVVWTLKVIGGEPFAIQPKDGPVLTHDGTLSVWNISLREHQAQQLAQIARRHGADVPLLHAETDRTGGGLRGEQLDLQGEDYPFPTPRCPGCFWFDPSTKTGCGHVDWPPEMREGVLPKAWEDLRLCPGLSVSPSE